MDAVMRVALGGRYTTVTATMGACDQDNNGDDALTIRTSTGAEETKTISPAAPIIDYAIDVTGAEYLEFATKVPSGGCFILASVAGLPT